MFCKHSIRAPSGFIQHGAELRGRGKVGELPVSRVSGQEGAHRIHDGIAHLRAVGRLAQVSGDFRYARADERQVVGDQPLRRRGPEQTRRQQMLETARQVAVHGAGPASCHASSAGFGKCAASALICPTMAKWPANHLRVRLMISS